MSTVTVRTAIVDTIRTGLGASALHVASHAGRFSVAELMKISAKAPAVLVSALAMNNIKSWNGSVSATVSWAAFVVVKDTPTAPRDQVALLVIDKLKKIIPENQWGLTDEVQGDPREIRAQNLFSAEVDAKGMAMWALSWSQDIADSLGANTSTLDDFLRMDTTTDVDPEQTQEPGLVQTIELPAGP